MPTRLSAGEVPSQLSRYPHMLADDAQVWTAWLAQYPGVARSVWYDLHVGDPVSPPAGAPEYVGRVAAGVSRKRIDVVLLTGTEYVVTEIKPWASYTALGQALLYWRLFQEEYRVVESCRPGIICGSVDPDIWPEIKRFGIQVWEVWPAGRVGNTG